MDPNKWRTVADCLPVRLFLQVRPSLVETSF